MSASRPTPGTSGPSSEHPPETAGWLGAALPHPLAAFARTRPDHVALRVRDREGVVGRPIDAAQLRRAAALLASDLRDRGLRPGDRIALLGRRSAAWIIALHGIGWLGASVVPLDPKAPPASLRPRVEAARATLVIDPQRLPPALAEFTAEGMVPLDSAQLEATARPRIDPPQLAPPTPWGLGDERALLFTSGSTGEPKPVSLSTAQLLFATVGGALHLGHELGDCWHACLPPWHIGGLAIALRTAWCQTTLDLGLGFFPEAIGRAIDRGTITQISLVPAMLRRLTEARRGRRFPASLRWILLGGAAADEADIVAAEALGALVCPTWGMTESAAQIATRSPATPRQGTPGLVGPPLPFAQVEQEGNGERLWISGPQLGDASPFLTQDRGEVSLRGQISVHGRADRLVISGGRNIDPAAVERVLLRHPAVDQALVLGLPDTRLGEQLIAVVVPKTGAALDRDPPPLARFAATQLHRYDRPRRWALLRALPTTAAGKLSAATRSSVRDRVLAALDLERDPQGAQALQEGGRRIARTEALQVDERVLVLDPGVKNIIGPVRALDPVDPPLDKKDHTDPTAATPADEDDPLDRQAQAISEANRPAKVGLGVDHRQPPARRLHGRKPGPEGAAEDIFPGLVAPLEEAAKKGDTGGVDLGKTDDVGVGIDHPQDLRPSARTGQGPRTDQADRPHPRPTARAAEPPSLEKKPQTAAKPERPADE